MALLPLQLAVFLSSILAPGLAAITNRTIDDRRGDSVTGNMVSYQGSWKSSPCMSCPITPDPAQAFDGTWTDATYLPQSQEPLSATLTFTGTAIWVFFILANNAGTGDTSQTLANITLDNQVPRLFEHSPDDSTSNPQYNALVFSQENLENVHHSLVISVSGPEAVYVNFDYAIYTHDDVVVGASGNQAASPAGQTPAHVSVSQAVPVTLHDTTTNTITDQVASVLRTASQVSTPPRIAT